MDEFFKALRHFITRDLVYLVGGGSVVASFLYTFDRLPTPNDHVVVYLLIAGISYVVGYALQDGFSFLPGFTTTTPRTLNRYQRFLYERYTRTRWEEIPEATNFQQVENALRDERQTALLERIISLQQVGTTVGPCWLVSAGLLGVRWWFKGGGRFGLALASASLFMGLVLAHLAWVRAGQQAQYLSRHEGKG